MALPVGGLGYDPVATFLGKPVKTDEEIAASLQVPRSVVGLRELSRTYAWASVLELSASLLASVDDNDGDSDEQIDVNERMEVAAWRGLALLQTRQEERAADMLRTLDADLNDESREAQQHVPFFLKAVIADANARLAPEQIEHVYDLKRQCGTEARASKDDKMRKLWTAREGQLLSVLAVLHSRSGQHDSAVDVARELVRQQGHTARALYVYARVLLGIGDVTGARNAVARASQRPDDDPPLRLSHEAMLLAAEGRYEEAAARYDASAHLCKEGNVWAFAANNAAICLLHLGKCDEAVAKLETCLRRDPEIALDEGIVVNTATLYDLTSPDAASKKKKVLKSLASKYARQGFNLDVISVT